jgi:hypothetical protein
VPIGFYGIWQLNRIHLTANEAGGSPAAEPTTENLRKSGYQFNPASS